MASDVVDLRDFYRSALGQVARRMIRRAIQRVWPDLHGMRLLGIGYAKQMLISHDTVNCWRGRPLPSHMLPVITDWEPTYIFRVVLPKLREVGYTEETISQILVDNPRRFFAGS